MGQYFLAVNETKRQYVCPWCIGGGAKLWEWMVNDYAGLFVLLLRQSNESGGGDWDGYHNGYDEGDCVKCKPGGEHSRLDKLVGSWAGDSVVLVGDYDQSNLFDIAREEYQNISRDIGQAFNRFTGSQERQLTLEACDGCNKV